MTGPPQVGLFLLDFCIVKYCILASCISLATKFTGYTLCSLLVPMWHVCMLFSGEEFTYSIYQGELTIFLQTWLWWSKSWVFLSSLSWDLQPLLRSLWVLGQWHLHGPDQPHLLIHPQQPGVVQVCWEDCQLGHCSGVPTWRLLHKNCLQVLALQVSECALYQC